MKRLGLMALATAALAAGGVKARDEVYRRQGYETGICTVRLRDGGTLSQEFDKAPPGNCIKWAAEHR